MANLKLDNKWNNGFYQLETTDPVMGGEDGIDNLQAKQLGANIFFIRGKGIAEWANNITYSKHSLVNVNGELYISLVDNNLNIAITDSTKWEKLIKQATTLASGIVKLNNATNSTSTTEAATANAVKVTMEKASSAATAADNAQNTANTAKSTAETDASTNVKGRVQLNSAINSSAENQAATPKAVKTAYDLANTGNTTANTAKSTAETDASTTVKGRVQLNSAVNSTVENQAATPKAVKAAYDLAAKATQKAYITDVFKSSDSSSWYRKWSDGFIEQGGYANITGSVKTINLLTPMNTVQYSINANNSVPNGNTSNFTSLAQVIGKKTTTQFLLLCGDNSAISYGVEWMVRGY